MGGDQPRDAGRGFREALLRALDESKVTIKELAELSGVNRVHLNRIALGTRTGPVRDDFRRRVASALARVGGVSEETIEAVAGGTRLYLDILVDREQAGDLFSAVVYDKEAEDRLHEFAADYLSSVYARLQGDEDRGRFLEFVLFWVRVAFYGMGSRKRVEDARKTIQSGRAAPSVFSEWVQQQRGVFATMALTLAACTWRNMALLFPLTRERPAYLNLLNYREELPGPVTVILEEAQRRRDS